MSQQNGDGFTPNDTDGRGGPNSELDIYAQVLDDASDKDAVAGNLGLGNYEKAEFWQQVQSYYDGLYAVEAFAERLGDRAREECKRELADHGFDWDNGDGTTTHLVGWRDLTDEERAEKDRRRYLEARGEELWDQLDTRRRRNAVAELTNVSESWRPPHLRMLEMRHEASRSVGARLIDNVFGRVSRTEVKDETSGENNGALARFRRNNRN